MAAAKERSARVLEFGGGVLDELVAECDAVQVRRTGVARYEIEMQTATGRELVRLWTTAKARIEVSLDVTVGTSVPADWFAHYDNSKQELTNLGVSNCTAHFEHLDRGHYMFALEHASGTRWRLDFSAPGYLKARTVEVTA